MTLETISTIAQFVFSIMWAVGLVQGIIAWAKRGYAIPRAVPVTAAVVAGIGLLIATVAFIFGIEAGGFALFSLFIFPLMVYFIWFLLGCPCGEKQTKDRQGDSSKHYVI